MEEIVTQYLFAFTKLFIHIHVNKFTLNVLSLCPVYFKNTCLPINSVPKAVHV